MSETYIKAHCCECNESIEYPEWAKAEKVECPHCGKTITLGDCPVNKKSLVRIPVSHSDTQVLPTVVDNKDQEIARLKQQIEDERYRQMMAVEENRNHLLAESVQQQRRGNTIGGVIAGACILDFLSDIF